MGFVRRLAVALSVWWCVGIASHADDGTSLSISALLESADYVGSPLDEKREKIEAWMAQRDPNLRDAEWARAASQRITVIARQGDLAGADTYADTVLEDMLLALGDSGEFISAAYGVGFVKIYAQKIDQTLLLIDRMRNHPLFSTSPVYQQNVDTLMVGVHTQTGNPILAADVLITKYNDGTIDTLPPLDQLKLISNIAYALIKGRAYQESEIYLDAALERLERWMDSGMIDEPNVSLVRWHINYNRAEMLVHQEKFDELPAMLPQLKADADTTGAPLFISQVDYIAAAIAYSQGRFDDAELLISQAIETTAALGAPDGLIELFALEAKNFEAANRPEDALRSYLKGKALDDDLKAEEGRARVEYMNTRRTLLERNAQIKELEAKTTAAEQMQKRDQIIAAVTSSGLALVLFFALALVRSQHRLRTYADELEESEKKAQIAVHAKATFLANMSHEIRTPLNGLLGMTQVLAEKRYGGEHDECVDVILKSGKSLLTIVNDVLDLSKIEAGKMAVSPRPTNIPDLVKDVVGLWSVSAHEKGIDFNVVVDPGLPTTALFDGERIRQCASNLVSNAIKFTEQGHVTFEVTSRNDGKTLAIVVEDTGPGIKEDVVATLFTAFEQGDTSSKRKFGGTGLGLSIVHSFAELMGGSVTVESTYGEGSRFELVIPVTPLADHKTSQPTKHIASTSVDWKQLNNINTILLVDDNHVNRMVVKAFLKSSDIRIIEAGNGLEALDCLKANSGVDLVLMDMHMPEMDGPECIEHIRASDENWQDVPVLVLTADAMEGDRERYMRLSVQGYLAKPVVQADLWAEIRRIDVTHNAEQLKHTG